VRYLFQKSEGDLEAKKKGGDLYKSKCRENNNIFLRNQLRKMKEKLRCSGRS